MSTEDTPLTSPLKLVSDEELALSAAAGSVTAFAELLDRYEHRIYNYVLRRIPSPADAEDITQETSVRAWQRIGQYNRRWAFSTWMFTIASRLATNHLRASARRQRNEAAAAENDASDDDDPSSQLGRDETCRHIWSLAAEVLTPDQHAAMWLRYAEEFSIGQIARVLGRSSVGCRVLLFRARQKLMENIEDAPVVASSEKRGATIAKRQAAKEARPPYHARLDQQTMGGA